MVVGSDELNKIDTQHRQLRELARDACHTLENESNPTEFKGTLTRLLDFTVAHFTEEENLMRCLSYKGLKSHKRTHAILLNSLAELERETFIFDDSSKERLLKFIVQEFRYHEIEDNHAWKVMKN